MVVHFGSLLSGRHLLNLGALAVITDLLRSANVSFILCKVPSYKIGCLNRILGLNI